jgi:pimeloyl-ACP methyl ester carboxylesterase
MMMERRCAGTTLASTVAAVLALLGPGAACAADEPLTLAREGFFYVGGKLTTVDGRTFMAGQIYVDYRIPAKETHPHPIIMVHGGTRSGTAYFGTPDGREGWAQFFVRQGYAVYVVDQAGRGRSGYLAESYGRWRVPNLEGGERRYLAQEKFKLWPQALRVAQARREITIERGGTVERYEANPMGDVRRQDGFVHRRYLAAWA